MTISQSLLIARVSFSEKFTGRQREIVKFLIATGGEKSVAEIVRRKMICERTVREFVAQFKDLLHVSLDKRTKLYTVNIPVLARLIGIKNVAQNAPMKSQENPDLLCKDVCKDVCKNVCNPLGIYNNINNIYINKQNKNKTHDVRKSFFKDDKILENEGMETVPIPTPVVPPAPPPPPIPETPPIEEDEKPKPIINKENHLVGVNKMVEQDHIPDDRKMVEQDFQAFWQAMPRKQGEMQARKAFQDAIKAGYSPKEIIAGAEGYAKQQAGIAVIYCKIPANWLAEMRWLDAYTDSRCVEKITEPVDHESDDLADKTLPQQAWSSVRRRLKIEFGDAVFKSWINRVDLKEINSNTVILTASSRFVREWVESRYGDRIRTFWRHEGAELGITDVEICH